MKNIFYKNQLTLIALMLFSLSACGGGNSPENGSASANQGQGATNSSSTSNPLSPGNLPPPGSTASAQSENKDVSTSSQFFARKQLWDSFSEPLKAQIMKSYNAKLSGPGPGGIGYFNTLFGRVSPKKAGSSQSALIKDQGHFLKSGQRTYLMDYVGAQDVNTLTCPDQFTQLLCLISPTDQLNTIFDSVIVAGTIQMERVALFSPTDPALMISVFNASGDAVAQEIPVYGTDITTSLLTPPSAGDASEGAPAPVEIGVFNKSVPLMGPGAYTVVITYNENIGGNDVNPQSAFITVYRQDVPTIELLTITPPPTGNQRVQDESHRNDPIKKSSDNLAADYEVGMTDVNLVVKVSTAAKSTDALKKNVGILFQNYDQNDVLRYSSSGNESFSPVSLFVTDLPNDQSPAKKAELPLFDGMNKIVITSHNQQLDDYYIAMGLPPPPPQVIRFKLENRLPHVNIKLLSPAEGSVVEPKAGDEDSVKISFCMTDLPSFPGRELAGQQGACIPNWSGDEPVVKFNNVQYSKSSPVPLTYDASTGIYSITTKPTLGSNILTVSVTNKNYLPSWTDNADPQKPVTITQNLGELTATFLYGKMNKIIENGKLNETDNLLKRGISLQINRNLVTHDVKKMLEKYLNQDSFKQSLADLFKKNDASAPVVCPKDGGGLTFDHGDTTINFLPDLLSVGNIVINQIEPKSDNRLYLDVTIQGLHGEADLRGFNAPVKIVIGGKDASFIPISVLIKELHAKIALRFEKENGLNKLVIEKQYATDDAVTLVGDGPMGNVAHVNSSRNPLAKPLEDYDSQTGTLSKSFKDTLQSTLLCGVAGGLNNKESGLPRWDADLLKLVSYNNQNPFRISTEFDLLNKTVGLDIAYDILRGDIKFAYNGIVISNVPLRFTPSPKILNDLMTQYTSGVLGSLSMPFQAKEDPPSLPGTDENKNISLSLSEDAINQALSAATAAGVLSLDIDPNFYTSHKIDFISLALPTVDGMFPNKKVDFNQNGVQDDENLPLLLRLRGNPLSPPTLHFLNKQEVNVLAEKVNASLGAGNGSLNKDLHIFRLSISNLELAFYALQQISPAQGGYKSFCTNTDDSLYSDPDLESKRGLVAPIIIKDSSEPVLACSQKLSLTYENTQGSCGKGYKNFTAPVKNGAVISALPNEAEVPVIRMKANLVIYGVLQGVYREVLAADKWDLDPKDSSKGVVKNNALPSTFARIKVLNYAPADPLIQLNVTENHSSFSEKDLTNYLVGTVLNTALGKECEYFNEIRIPIPDSFLKDKSTLSDGLKQTLQDFGLDYINLGLSNDQIPEIPYNDGMDASSPVSNPLYLDLKAHLGLCLLGDTCN